MTPTPGSLWIAKPGYIRVYTRRENDHWDIKVIFSGTPLVFLEKISRPSPPPTINVSPNWYRLLLPSGVEAMTTEGDWHNDMYPVDDSVPPRENTEDS